MQADMPAPANGGVTLANDVRCRARPEVASVPFVRHFVKEAELFFEGAGDPTLSRRIWLQPVAYGVSNIIAATSIVFANKAVSSFYGFSFTVALTLCHTLTTVAGLALFCQFGVFTQKRLGRLQLMHVVPLVVLLAVQRLFSWFTVGSNKLSMPV